MSEINYRWMKPEEIVRLADIDRGERIRTGYEIQDGELHKMDVNWDTPSWSTMGDGPHTFKAHIANCQKYFDKGGVMYGAFDGDTLVGIGILQPDIRPGMAQLAFLHVSRAYRRSGVGVQIATILEVEAIASGANQFYVSATPTGSAIGFYTKFGFKPTDEPVPELFELEPDDIHMLKTF
jgi:ribosomal protein S18 acetylase RimI-like enzyme